MAKAGRPTKLTPALQEQICLSLRAGNYLETACKANGINKVTLYNWLDRAAKHHEPMYVAFLNAVEKAQSEAAQRDVALIAQAAASQWQVAAWPKGQRTSLRLALRGSVRNSMPQ